MAQRGSGSNPPSREVVAQAKEGSAEARAGLGGGPRRARRRPAQGSAEAHARLIGHYYQPVRTFLRRRGDDPARSDDLAHDVFVYALAHLDELDRDTSFRAWLYRIARSRAGQEWRRPERGREVSLDVAAGVPTPMPSPADEVVRHVLAELSPAQREVLEGHGLHRRIDPRARRADQSLGRGRQEELHASQGSLRGTVCERQEGGT